MSPTPTLNIYLFEGPIKAYLSHRKYKVYPNNEFSRERPVVFGIPKGSIMGSISVGYINDLNINLL
jgi:hypothetical protein